jgi:hypothetical protein
MRASHGACDESVGLQHQGMLLLRVPPMSGVHACRACQQCSVLQDASHCLDASMFFLACLLVIPCYLLHNIHTGVSACASN